MNRPTITASHETPVEKVSTLSGTVRTWPGVTLEVTYEQGNEAQAVALLDAAYADVKRQITGMTTIVHATRQED